MLNLSLNELSTIARSRGVRSYRNMARERLLSACEGSERDIISARIKKIRKDLNKLKHRLLRWKINEIRKNLCKIENIRNLSKSKIKTIEKYVTKLEESLYNFKKYHDYDDIKYYKIRDIEKLFGEVDEDYYRSIKTKSNFKDKHIEYESRGDKDKYLSLKEYLYMIIPYLRDMINNHETPMKLRVHQRDEIIDCKTQFGDWKIQLIMASILFLLKILEKIVQSAQKVIT